MYFDSGIEENLPVWSERIHRRDKYDIITQAYIDLANDKKNPVSKKEIAFLLNASFDQLKRHAADYLIYFISQGLRGPIKIGKSENPKKRILDIQTNTPRKLYLLATMPRVLHFNEDYVLRTFDYLNIRGEWYYPGYDLITLIRILRTHKPHHGTDNPWVYMLNINRNKSMSE